MLVFAVILGFSANHFFAGEKLNPGYLRLKIDAKNIQPGKSIPQNPNQPGNPGGQVQPNNPNDPNNPNGMQYPSQWIEARIPFKKWATYPQNPRVGWIEHRWGKTSIPTGIQDPAVIARVIENKLVNTRYRIEENRLKKNELKPEEMLILAKWCLKYAKIDKLEENMDKLIAKAPEDGYGKIYKKVREIIGNPLSGIDPKAESIVQDLRRQGYQKVTSDQGHYVLLTTQDPDDEAVRLRLEGLERNFKIFYYWFALKGYTLPAPKHQMVAVLVTSPRDFREMHSIYKIHPQTGDSFISTRDNVIFLSAIPFSESYRVLDQRLKGYLQSLRITMNIAMDTDQNQNRVFPEIQAMALIKKITLRDLAFSTTSHQGTRQLLASTGLLPENIPGFEWLRFGIASFFETSRLSFYPSPTLPHWVHHVNLRYYREKKKLLQEDEARKILLSVITDQYFQKAYRSIHQAKREEDEEKQEKLQEKAEKDLEIAQSTAWALAYYLMKRPMNLMEYLEEIKSLPRDLEYSDHHQALLFSKAFRLSLATSTKPTPLKNLDLQEIQRFGEQWLSRMSRTTTEISSVENQVMDEREEEAKKPKRKPQPKTGEGAFR